MFFTIVIQFNAQSIYRYETITQAKEKFHTELAYAYNQNLKCTCVVMDEHGAVYKSEEFIPTEE
jgi:hypothetical protein